MLTLPVINTLRGLAAGALRAGLVPIAGVHELSRAMLALDAQEAAIREEEKRLSEETEQKRAENKSE